MLAQAQTAEGQRIEENVQFGPPAQHEYVTATVDFYKTYQPYILAVGAGVIAYVVYRLWNE